MGIISRFLKQKAVYWAPAGNDGYGNQSFDAAIEIDCRYETSRKIITDANGAELVSESTVYADRVLEEGGYLKKGELIDLDSGDLGSPIGVSGAFEILKFEQLPNVRNTETLFTASL